MPCGAADKIKKAEVLPDTVIPGTCALDIHVAIARHLCNGRHHICALHKGFGEWVGRSYRSLTLPKLFPQLCEAIYIRLPCTDLPEGHLVRLFGYNYGVVNEPKVAGRQGCQL